jgi:hypothetical protein
MKTAAANSSMLSAGFPDACRDWRRVLIPHQAKKASFRLPASKFMGCRTFGSFSNAPQAPWKGSFRWPLELGGLTHL